MLVRACVCVTLLKASRSIAVYDIITIKINKQTSEKKNKIKYSITSFKQN